MVFSHKECLINPQSIHLMSASDSGDMTETQGACTLVCFGRKTSGIG